MKTISQLFLVIFALPALVSLNYGQSGSLDPTYSISGYTLYSVNFFTGTNWATASVMQPDDKLVVAVDGANYPPGTGEDNYVLRYQSDGTVDPSFGSGGIVRIAFTTPADEEMAAAVTLQSDGKIVIASTLPTGIGLARLNVDGTLDASFGTGGKVIFKWANKEVAVVYDALVQSDGKIVVCGSSGTKFAFARFTAAGQFDTTFNGTGKFTLQASTGSAVAYIAGLAQQSDGKLIGVGERPRSNRDPFGHSVLRLNTNGTLDSSFGTNGQVYSNFDDQGLGGMVRDRARSVKVDPAGNIVVAGTALPRTSDARWAFIRLLPNGQKDPSFGGDGKVLVGFPGYHRLHGSLLLENGKIVASGGLSQPGQLPDIAVFRLLSDGSLDPSFGSGGVATTDIDGRSDQSSSLTRQSDGKYVVAGFAGNYNYIFTGRYLP